MAGKQVFRRKKEKKAEEGAAEWLLTYGDMVTLLLVFFVTLFSVEEVVEPKDFNLFTINYAGVGNLAGGNTISKGKLAELGNDINALPSSERDKRLEKAKESAISQFREEMHEEVVQSVRIDQRGLVISLAADAFFSPASAVVDLEKNRSVLQKLAAFLSADMLRGMYFRIEGHSDKVATDLTGPWKDNWELSVMRSVNIFEYLLNYTHVPREEFEQHFELSGYGDTRPLMDNKTAEGRAYNRRIDVVVLSPGNLSMPREVVLKES